MLYERWGRGKGFADYFFLTEEFLGGCNPGSDPTSPKYVRSIHVRLGYVARSICTKYITRRRRLYIASFFIYIYISLSIFFF